MDNDNINPTGITGLAMIVGQLRAELDRLRDDGNRDLAALRTEFADFRAERESREVAMLDAISTLTDAVGEIATTAKGAGPAGTKPVAADDDPAPLPTLNASERATDYHKRVAAWAKDNGEEEPPKPPTGPVANSRAYASKVARFYDAD